jgi:hypothetical protein
MRKRRHRSSSPVESLRLAIDCMPVATREAMLTGVRRYERIIVGAYTDERGGVCPMLAAHRCGGRTDFLAFAKSWDRFARARAGRRQATARELRILVDQLEASLASLSNLELDRAIAEHHALVAELAQAPPQGAPRRGGPAAPDHRAAAARRARAQEGGRHVRADPRTGRILAGPNARLSEPSHDNAGRGRRRIARGRRALSTRAPRRGART